MLDLKYQKKEKYLTEMKSSEKQNNKNLNDIKYFTEIQNKKNNNTENIFLGENIDNPIYKTDMDQNDLNLEFPFNKKESNEILKETIDISNINIIENKNFPESNLLPYNDDINKKKLFKSVDDSSNNIDVSHISNNNIFQINDFKKKISSSVFIDNNIYHSNYFNNKNIPSSTSLNIDNVNYICNNKQSTNYLNNDIPSSNYVESVISSPDYTNNNNIQPVEIIPTESDLKNVTIYDNKYANDIVNNDVQKDSNITKTTDINQSDKSYSSKRSSRCNCDCGNFCYYCCSSFCTGCLTALCNVM